MSKDKTWYRFQEEIKKVFIKLGCDAETNVRVQGVRTIHDIDIFVNSKYVGQDIKWIIEAKYWNNKVSKLHVLALRQIVDDIGADKGFIISEKGFQKGAIEAATNSNISLQTFDDLLKISNETFQYEILKTYSRRLNYILNRYFSHSKVLRIKYKLREDPYVFKRKFSVYVLLFAIRDAIIRGIENEFPIKIETYLEEKYGDSNISNFYQLINWLNCNLIEIEERILKAEVDMQKNGEFNPELDFIGEDKNIHTLMLRLSTYKF